MPAYLIARVRVTDMEAYRHYMAATPACIAKYGGRFIVRGGTTLMLEGEPEDRRVVIIEFPSMQQAEVFYNSPEYTKARELRAGAAVGQFFIVEGVG